MTQTTRPTIRIHNISTNKIIDREMNDKEFESFELVQIELAQQELQQLAKAEARSAAEAKLLALGLTAEDLKALLG